ncbi:MAG: putative manganese-dependent inorganic diphosphatase [Selenomonadaceae bacterium]|nr:putative manganese-dependent inorganic diphosphatase [Selenomonadaceae bacterium]
MQNAKPVYVIGHRNPDTDSICSAIAYAALKQAGGENAIAARAGQVNAETQYALDYFKAEAPMLLSDLYPRVKDIMLECHTVVKETDSLRYLGSVLQKNNLRSVPVTDDDGRMVGIVTVSDLAQRYFEELNMQDLGEAAVSLKAIVDIIDGEVIVESDENTKVKGKVHIAAGSKTTIKKWVSEGDVVLVGEGQYASMQECLLHNIACLIVTNEGNIPEIVKQDARRTHSMIVRTPLDTFTAARLINQSIPVGHIMQKKLTAFQSHQLLSDIRGTIEASKFRNYPVVDNERLVGIVSRDNLMLPEPERVILVDHNERGQAVEGIEDAKILEIVDHHRLGGMQTGEPIYIREEPVGCTATIIANMYWQKNVEISPQIAGLLLSAIISDTVLFKSPTCTGYDKITSERLAKLADVQIEEYGMALLKAGAGIGDMTPSDIAKNDMKEFQIGDYHILVSQLSVMDVDEVMEMKAELLESMNVLCTTEHFDMCLLMVTDILKESTELLYVGSPKTLIGEAFMKDASGDSIYLPGVMSRKKQIIPPLTDAVQRMPK